MAKINKKDGFDCQSCAWPNPEDRHLFEFCENGVKALTSEATKKQIGPEFFREHWIADLRERTDNWLELQGRLVHPMVKRAGATHYEPIEWDEAFELMARELNALPTPNAAVFYTSGRTSNEAAFLYQLFARQFGTNNLPDCSNMCHESSGVALKESIGIGIMKEMLEEEERRVGAVLDRQFIARFTTEFEEFAAHVRATPWDQVLEASGLTREQIRGAAEIAIRCKRIICCWAMGLTQHRSVTAHVSIKLNRAYLITGEIALILPCLGRSEIDRQRSGEQFVTVEDSMGIINPSRGHAKPASKHLRSEPAIVTGLAKATLASRSTVDWDALVANCDRIRDHIEHVVAGFDDFNARIHKDVFYLPNARRTTFHGCANRDRAALYCDLFSGSERARFNQQQCRSQQHAGEQKHCHQHRPID